MQKIIAAFDGLKYSTSTRDHAIALARSGNMHLTGVFLDDVTYTSYKVYELITKDGVSDKKLKQLAKKDYDTRNKAVADFENACRKAGVEYNIHHDRKTALKELLHAALPDGPSPCDAIVVIGGSSGGKRDFSAQAIAGLLGCEICGHDQRVSSGRPLTLARVGQTAVWGLPGHSLSLALAAQVFLAPLLQRLAGQQASPQHMNRQPVVLARLGLALPVEGNAPTHYPVMLRREHGRVTAWPVAAGTGKTAVLRDMDGWITMPGSDDMSRGGLRRGAAVRVHLFA